MNSKGKRIGKNKPRKSKITKITKRRNFAIMKAPDMITWYYFLYVSETEPKDGSFVIVSLHFKGIAPSQFLVSVK